MKNTKTIGLLSSLIFTPVALAHPGHDHGHWLSDPIHILSVIAMIGLLVASYSLIRKNGRKKIQKIENPVDLQKGKKHER